MPLLKFEKGKSSHAVPLPYSGTMKETMSQIVLQQAQFQVKQQKINSQLALQLAQLTTKEAQHV